MMLRTVTMAGKRNEAPCNEALTALRKVVQDAAAAQQSALRKDDSAQLQLPPTPSSNCPLTERGPGSTCSGSNASMEP